MHVFPIYGSQTKNYPGFYNITNNNKTTTIMPTQHMYRISPNTPGTFIKPKRYYKQI
eukprot:GAHX01003341.1.p1 GENE.GAHX01003341.1~~GAHX01003341.1.p1  ORF type:complete len:57 (-),score=8.65 GAHX01003341.1:98-268(-)